MQKWRQHEHPKCQVVVIDADIQILVAFKIHQDKIIQVFTCLNRVFSCLNKSAECFLNLIYRRKIKSTQKSITFGEDLGSSPGFLSANSDAKWLMRTKSRSSPPNVASQATSKTSNCLQIKQIDLCPAKAPKCPETL